MVLNNISFFSVNLLDFQIKQKSNAIISTRQLLDPTLDLKTNKNNPILCK